MSAEKREIGAMSVDTQVVAKLLATAQTGQVVTYEQMGVAVGLKDIRAHDGIMYSARRAVRRDNKIVFSAVENVGLKRLDDEQNIEQSQAGLLRRIRGACRETAKNLACVEYGQLSNEKKVEHNLAASLAAGLYQATTAKRIERVGSVVREAQDKLPTEKLLAAFLTNGNGKA